MVQAYVLTTSDGKGYELINNVCMHINTGIRTTDYRSSKLSRD